MTYRIAAIDIPTNVLMVVVATAAAEVADTAGKGWSLSAGNSERVPRNASTWSVGCSGIQSPKL